MKKNASDVAWVRTDSISFDTLRPLLPNRTYGVSVNEIVEEAVPETTEGCDIRRATGFENWCGQEQYQRFSGVPPPTSTQPPPAGTSHSPDLISGGSEIGNHSVTE